MATVTFHGVRGSCPCSDPSLRRYGGATACVSIQPEADAAPVVLDLGTGSRMLGEQLLARYFPGTGPPAGAPVADPAVVHPGLSDASPSSLVDGPVVPPELSLFAFVSHLHFDHVQGLPFFGPALRPDVRLDIYGPHQRDGSLKQSFAAFVRPPFFPVALDELPASIHWHEMADGDEARCGYGRVRAREIPHVGRTLGYRVECDGQAIAYIGDHQAPRDSCQGEARVSPAALDLAGAADVMIHDAQYTAEEFAVKAHWGHSTLGYAIEVARAAEVSKLVLFHHDPTHDDASLDRMGSQATDLAPSWLEVLVAAEGMTIKLGD
ncbi:MAG: MBL fold metallo-hydrolase [Acidimicrobiales bacterium]